MKKARLSLTRIERKIFLMHIIQALALSEDHKDLFNAVPGMKDLLADLDELASKHNVKAGKWVGTSEILELAYTLELEIRKLKKSKKWKDEKNSTHREKFAESAIKFATGIFEEIKFPPTIKNELIDLCSDIEVDPGRKGPQEISRAVVACLFRNSNSLKGTSSTSQYRTKPIFKKFFLRTDRALLNNMKIITDFIDVKLLGRPRPEIAETVSNMTMEFRPKKNK